MKYRRNQKNFGEEYHKTWVFFSCGNNLSNTDKMAFESHSLSGLKPMGPWGEVSWGVLAVELGSPLSVRLAMLATLSILVWRRWAGLFIRVTASLSISPWTDDWDPIINIKRKKSLGFNMHICLLGIFLNSQSKEAKCSMHQICIFWDMLYLTTKIKFAMFLYFCEHKADV